MGFFEKKPLFLYGVVSRPADAEKTFEIGNVQPDFSQPIFTPEPARNEAAPGGHDVQVIAVLDFDEDDESERNGTDDSGNYNKPFP